MDFDNENRIVSPDFNEADSETELSLRPKTLNEYIGQEKAKENLKVYIEAAKARGEQLDQFPFFYGYVYVVNRDHAKRCVFAVNIRQILRFK